MPKIKTISASSISTYENCPLGWYYNYILKLIQLPNPAFIIGTAYHHCLEKFHKGLTKENILLQLKEELLSKKPTDEEIERFGTVRKMFEKYLKNPLKGEVLQTEFQFTIPLDYLGIPIPLFGYIDRKDVDKTVEYKTSSFDYKEEDIKTIQSKLYCFARWKMEGKILPVVYCINNKNKINNDSYIPQQMEIQYTLEDMKDVEKSLKKFYNEIESTDKFKPTPGVHCRWCPYGKNGTDNCPYSIC